MTNTESTFYDRFQEILDGIYDIVIKDVDKDIRRLIAEKKEPFLREVLSAMQSGSDLEERYTASDILTLLESIEETFKVKNRKDE